MKLWFLKRRKRKAQEALEELQGLVTEAKKKQIVSEVMQMSGEAMLFVFKVCSLKECMVSHLYNAPTNEYFEITFKPIAAKDVKIPEHLKPKV